MANPIILSCRILIRMALLASLLGTTAALAVEVVDDDGNTVRLAQPAERIVSLAPSMTELLFAAGAGDRIVGVVEYSDYPPAATSIPIIGRHDLLDLETILGLQPDLVVAWKTGNPGNAVAQLKELGLTVFIAEPKELGSIPSHLERFAQLAGTQNSARLVIDDFTSTLSHLRQSYSVLAPVKVFYQVWDSPLITAGGNELINDMITLCGGSNVFADLRLMAPKVDTESVLARNPQVIIASGMDVARPEWLDDWQRWPSLDAVSQGHLYFIPPELVQRHTPRALQGVTQMCEQIDRAR